MDLEFVGPSPRFADHMTLWATLQRDEDRDALFDAVTGEAPPRAAGDLALLAHWAAARFLVETISFTPAALLNRDRTAQARRVLDEARRLHDLTP